MTASTPAQGMPAISRQIPTMMAWMKATPMTPCATARMVAVDSLVNSTPRSGPTMRVKIASQARLPALPEGKHDPCDDQGGEERQQPEADAGDEGECRSGDVTDLRLHALNQGRQVGMGLFPDRMHPFSDDRPFGDPVPRRRDFQGVRSAHR